MHRRLVTPCYTVGTPDAAELVVYTGMYTGGCIQEGITGVYRVKGKRNRECGKRVKACGNGVKRVKACDNGVKRVETDVKQSKKQA